MIFLDRGDENVVPLGSVMEAITGLGTLMERQQIGYGTSQVRHNSKRRRY